jgi:hypothetical protein
MLKTSIFTVVLLLLGFSYLRQQSHTSQSYNLYETVKQHKQVYNMSCIPSSIEMVLKYNRKVGVDYYELQNAWKEKSDGTFKNFNNKIIAGIKFTQQFDLPRSDAFPYDSLYKTIDTELNSGRKVIISLQSGVGLWHMYVLDSRTGSGDYLAYSRVYNLDEPVVVENVKQYIKAMKGTDIMTYKVQ